MEEGYRKLVGSGGRREAEEVKMMKRRGEDGVRGGRKGKKDEHTFAAGEGRGELGRE